MIVKDCRACFHEVTDQGTSCEVCGELFDHRAPNDTDWEPFDIMYPTELIARAKYEVQIFERVAADTGIELIAEVVMLRSLIRELRDAVPGGSTNARLKAAITESYHSVPEEA